MEKYFGEKQQRFSFRKLSVGLVSATISSLFFVSVLGISSVEAQETKGVHYKYVTESELSSEEKKQLVYDIPTYMENDDETYYLVYKLNSQNQLRELPNTGSKNEMQALVAGASLAALGILVFAVSKKKVKNKTVLHLVLVAGIGSGVLISAHALENHLLLNYNTDYELTSGEKLPLPKDISGYTYIGYIKEGKTTSDSKVSNQEKSASTPTKQQKVDYSVTPNFVENPSTVQAIQEQTPVSSTKPTEVQVVEKTLSTELTNPRKEEKQSSDSQAQLAEHKNLETKKDEKVSPKEKTGVNTLNPQDEVLSGQLNKPELLYRDETIETKIDFQEEIQENPDLAEGTVRVKQEGALGKKVEIVRIFSVNNEEVSREIVSTSTVAPISRIVEKGTKKTQVITEQPETGVEHKDVQSGAIVEPAIQPELPEAVVTDKGESEVQPELPEAVVTDKGEPEVQPELPEAVVTDKGEPAVQPELPEAVVTDKGETEVHPESPDTVISDKGEPEQVAPLPEYTGPQAGAIVEPEQIAPLPEYTGEQAGAIIEPEQVAPLPEYTGPQAGAVVEPAIQPELPEAVVTDKGEPEVQPALPEAVVTEKGEPAVQPELPEAVVTDKGETEAHPESPDTVVSDKGEPEQVAPLPEYTGVQAGAIVEPEKVEAPKEYTGVQAGAIVEPEQVEAPKEYTGVQSGAIVEPEKVEAPKEYTGKIEQPSAEETKPNNENTNTPEEMSIQKKSSALINMNFITDSSKVTGVGSATFIAPNVLLTVAHNFINNSTDNTTGEFRGDKSKNVYEWVTPDGQKGTFTANNIHFYNKKDYPKGFIYDLAVIKLPETTGRKHVNLVNNYSKVNVHDKLNVHGYPGGKYTHLKDTAVEMEQKYANNTYGVQYQGGNPGMSGGGIFNANGEVIGVHQNGAQNRSGGLILSPTQLSWIKSIIAGTEITPTYDALERHKDEKKDDVKEEKEVIKKLELRNISSVELYSKEGDKYRHVTSLATLPSNPETYFMKVKSENFKDVMLPVKSIESATKDNQDVYKIVGQANDLIQHENNSTLDNYTYYLPKMVRSENGVYTSFKNLVDAMNSNPNGTFHLGATMDAREVELQDGQESYVSNEFTGTLIGKNNDKYYAIYNLKKPLFRTLNRATVKDISIKDVNISAKDHSATIAKEAKNNTTLSNVHSNGIIAGERGIGGLVSQVDNSTISNSSFTGRITNTYETKSSYQIGGLVGKLSGDNASIDKSISSIDMATNANQGDQVVGGIAGVVDRSARISNSYVEGNLNNVKPFGKVGGVVGNLWDNSGEVENSGRLSDVLSDVNVTNGNAIAGYDFRGIKETNIYSNKNNKVVKVVQVDDEVLSKDSEEQRGTMLESNEVAEKKDRLVSKNNIKTEEFNFTSKYETDYRNVEDAVASRLRVYKNIEKLLPFYNRETIVKYGNLVDESSSLYTKELLSVVAMREKEVISDINKNKERINKLLLHYSDNTSQTLDVKYQQDFSKVAEYEIANTKLIYTPNTLLHNYDNIVKTVLNDLKSVQYDSGAVRKVLDISGDIKLTELYLDEQFDKTKESIGDSLAKLLSADAAIAENSNSIIDNYVIEKIKNNKEALLLGLTYLERWYNFNYGETNAKDLIMYHLDFFGKSNSSALDNVIELGKSGFNNLLAKNNVITYNVLLSKNYGTESLFKSLEGYRKVFLPNVSNNDWFKKQSKAYIVEEKSNIKEVREKQEKEGTEYSIGVYDRLTSPSWKYPSMVLPLLTLPEKSVFIIANISTIGFGAYDRYRSKEHPAGTNLNDYVETKAREAAARFRDHYDYWYKILDNENKEKLYRSVLVYDAFRFGTDDKGEKDTYQATFETNHLAIKHFFGPAGNNVVHNSNGAYATGDAFYYMAYRMLDKDGAVTYTHEMTHNSDREIYLGGYGRRNGLGPEFYAKGLLQAPDHPNDPTVTINSILKYDQSEEATRLQVADPTQRFTNAEDLHKYMHNMFDLIYTLEILEGRAVAKLDTNQKYDLLRKIENKFDLDQDGNNVYATNVVRRLTMDEVHKLNSFDSLIENDIITSRGYKDQEYKRNGYYTINLFSPIYSALSGEKGTPGDLMGRRIAFELLAAKGYKEGMVPYISNQYEKDAKAAGSKINSYGKEVGLVTDKLVLEKVFNSRYRTWVEFKKDMYKEREKQFSKLNRVNFINPNNPLSRQRNVSVTDISVLDRMVAEAVRGDAEDFTAQLYPDTNSRVLKLKKAIYKAYLDQTNDFRSSIFENKK
ncbi:IgA1 protease [Streptococcus pneumoniae]|nr:IgA1 protease [Streptococcus pneumoniae]